MNMRRGIIYCFIGLVVIIAILIFQYAVYESSDSLSITVSSSHSSGSSSRINKLYQHLFPQIIHNTWKSKDNPFPRDIKRWTDSCRSLNPEYRFDLYDDKDLQNFAREHYPEYFPFFSTLKGVCKSILAVCSS
jgi:mannosyltransferase OCH1-like enzyme